MLFRVFFELFNAALIAFLVLVPTFFPFHTSTRRIYLSHGTEVKVRDADSGAALGIDVLNHLGRGFITRVFQRLLD
jgi:hypothetical protein